MFYSAAQRHILLHNVLCTIVYNRMKEERKLYTTEMRMLSWARGKTLLDHMRNVDIWKKAHMYPMAKFLREKRLRWFEHVQRQDKHDSKR